MQVKFNKDKDGFQKSWLFQFGEGPFDVVAVYPVPKHPNIFGKNSLTNEYVEVIFEYGEWVEIKITSQFYTVPYWVKNVIFHSKWLQRV